MTYPHSLSRDRLNAIAIFLPIYANGVFTRFFHFCPSAALKTSELFTQIRPKTTFQLSEDSVIVKRIEKYYQNTNHPNTPQEEWV